MALDLSAALPLQAILYNIFISMLHYLHADVSGTNPEIHALYFSLLTVQVFTFKFNCYYIMYEQVQNPNNLV